MPSSSAGTSGAEAERQRQGEAGAEALDLEHLRHPAQRQGLRREGQGLAGGQAGDADQQERADQEHHHGSEQGVAGDPHQPALRRGVASRFSPLPWVTRLMPIRITAMTPAAA